MSRVQLGFVLTLGLLAAGCPQSPPDAPGAPVAELSSAALDFGKLGCGASAASRELTLRNTGTAALTFTAAASGAGFGVTPAEGTVQAGQAATLTVSAQVPAAATAGAQQKGTLTVATNDPAHASLDAALSAAATGATLSLSPSVASFGVLPVGTQAPDLPLTLTNTGDAAATVTVTQPADAQFSLRWTGAPAALAIAPGAAASGLVARFLPSKILPSSASATLSVEGPVCGASAGAVPMTGQGTNGVVGLSATDVSFGANGIVPCGTRAAAQTLTLSNTGNAAFSWNATLGRGSSSPFTFSPTSGTVPANSGSVVLTITTAAIPADGSTAPDAFGDVLTIVTDAANDTPHAVGLHQTAGGAVLAFAPTSVDFGLVPVNRTANAPFTVVNQGSLAANVTLTSSNTKFTVDQPGPLALGAAGNLGLTATFAPGLSVLPEQASVALAVDAGDVLCAPLPAPLALSGTGTNGSVSYSPVALDFGAVNCGTAAPAQVVTFRNDGNQDYTVTPVLAGGASSPFALSMSPDSGVVAQDGGTVVITVTPSAIPQTSAVTPNLYGDTLTVTTDVASDSPHDIPLRETARGAIFAVSARSLDFGSVAVGSTAASQFTVSNTGNAAGSISFTPGQAAIFNLPQGAVVAGNTSAALTGAFSPAAAASYTDTATVGVAGGTVLCQPLPFTSVSLAGIGTASNVVALSASSLTFGAGGLVPCGTQAAAKTVDVTNNSSQALALSAALALGAGSPYTVSAPATVAAGATATVTVTPRAVPATASTAVDGFADTLTITASGGPVNEAHTVALHETAQGAVLSFNPSGLSFSTGIGGSQTKSFTVNNTGNLAAPYTLSLGGANPGSFTVSPTAANAGAAGSVAHTATFNAPLTGTRSATVGLATSATRCAPLPAALTLSGQVN